ncbi:MAG: hypothetical protein SV377_05545 [Halobacteria archaeon]|nr:hypothetical protein [Halobacteria archaeon]
MDLFALQSGPLGINPLYYKIGVFLLAVISMITGRIDFQRQAKKYYKEGKIPFQRIHMSVNTVLVIASVYMTVFIDNHSGWIVLIFSTVVFISGILIHSNFKVQADKEREGLENPKGHITALVLLVLYTAYVAFWQLLGIGGLIFT